MIWDFQSKRRDLFCVICVNFCGSLVLLWWGEVLHAVLPLPVPAAVWGLVLLFIALESGKLKLSSVQDCGQFMLGLMPVLFIAPSVGLMDSWSMLASVWPAVLAIIVLSTVVVFAVSGVVTQTLMDFVSARENAGQPDGGTGRGGFR